MSVGDISLVRKIKTVSLGDGCTATAAANKNVRMNVWWRNLCVVQSYAWTEMKHDLTRKCA